MTRQEFIDGLRAELSAVVNYNIVNDNVSYYEDYITSEMQKGRSEQDILSQLGDPRLIAKTIIDAGKAAGDVSEGSAYANEDGSGSAGTQNSAKAFRIPGWLLIVLLIVIIVVVFGFITSLVSFILPVLLPVLAVVFVIKLFTDNRH